MISFEYAIAEQQGIINPKMYYLPETDLGFDVNDPNFKEKVINDVKASFTEEFKSLRDKHNVYEYIREDLAKLRIAIGGKKDSHLESLQSLFIGTTYGERRLYIVREPRTATYDYTFVGYLLYKKPDGTNVLKKIRRGVKEWELVEIKEKKPKKRPS